MTIFVSTALGYCTNKLAVWMLFHPVHPVNVFGCQIQGVIPREQTHIAQALGQTVAEELLMVEDLQAQLTAPLIVNKVATTLHASVEQALSITCRQSPMGALPVTARYALEGCLQQARAKLADLILKYAAHPPVKRAIVNLVDDNLVYFTKHRLDSLGDGDWIGWCGEQIQVLVLEAIQHPNLRDAIHGRTFDHIRSFMDSDTPLDEYMPVGHRQVIMNYFESHYRFLIDGFWSVFESDRIDSRIRSATAGTIIKYLLSPSSGLTEALVKWFATFDDERLINTIDGQLQSKISEFKEWSYGSEARQMLSRHLMTLLREMGSRSPSELLAILDQETLNRRVSRGLYKIIAVFMTETHVNSAVHALITPYIETARRIRPMTDYPVRTERIRSYVRTNIDAWLDQISKSAHARRQLTGVIENLISKYLYAPLTIKIAKTEVQRASRQLGEYGLRTLAAKLPDILAVIDIASIVEKRVKAYPATQMKNVIMAGSSEHLKLVELFGGVIGFTVGLVNGVFSYCIG